MYPAGIYDRLVSRMVSESVEAQIYVFMSEPISQRFVDTDCLRDCQDIPMVSDVDLMSRYVRFAKT